MKTEKENLDGEQLHAEIEQEKTHAYATDENGLIQETDEYETKQDNDENDAYLGKEIKTTGKPKIHLREYNESNGENSINLIYFSRGRTPIKYLVVTKNYQRFKQEVERFKSLVEEKRHSLNTKHHRHHKKNNGIFIKDYAVFLLRYFKDNHLKTQEINLLIERYFKVKVWRANQLINRIIYTDLNLTPTHKQTHEYIKAGYEMTRTTKERSIGINWQLNHPRRPTNHTEQRKKERLKVIHHEEINRLLSGDNKYKAGFYGTLRGTTETTIYTTKIKKPCNEEINTAQEHFKATHQRIRETITTTDNSNLLRLLQEIEIKGLQAETPQYADLFGKNDTDQETRQEQANSINAETYARGF